MTRQTRPRNREVAVLAYSGLATFEVFLTPLVFWLWAGGLMMAIGTVVVMWPNVRERAAMAAALGREEALGAQPVPGGD